MYSPEDNIIANWEETAISIFVMSDYKREIRSPVFLESKNSTSISIMRSNKSYLMFYPTLWVIISKIYFYRPAKIVEIMTMDQYIINIFTLSKFLATIASVTQPINKGVNSYPTSPNTLNINPTNIKHLMLPIYFLSSLFAS
jgi:hypothetical protein